MKRKHALVTIAITSALLLLVWLQFRSWKEFDWNVFLRQTSTVLWWRIALAVAIVYAVYPLRALRWRILLRPICQTSTWRLLGPQVVGFTGLALLGRPGELIRPYLIAKKHDLTISSQLAVWTVERVFDTGSFALILATNLLVAEYFEPELTGLRYYAEIRRGGFILLGGVIAAAALLSMIRRQTENMAALAQRLFGQFSGRLGDAAARRVRSFGEGLNTIGSWAAFAQISAISLLIWMLISFALLNIAQAYPESTRPGLRSVASLGYPEVLLLLGFSMAGSIVQLPAIGGGTQLASISSLVHIFGVSHEMAVSCGILMWLVGFMAVTPLGLWMARHEHIRLRELAEATDESAAEPA